MLCGARGWDKDPDRIGIPLRNRRGPNARRRRRDPCWSRRCEEVSNLSSDPRCTRRHRGASLVFLLVFLDPQVLAVQLCPSQGQPIGALPGAPILVGPRGRQTSVRRYPLPRLTAVARARGRMNSAYSAGLAGNGRGRPEAPAGPGCAASAQQEATSRRLPACCMLDCET
jgi:hypothetical protein